MVLHILIRLIGLFVVALVCFFTVSSGISLFSWHPILMSTGFLLLMTEAIMVFSSASSGPTKYNDRLNLHGLLQASACALIGFAFWAIYSHKTDNNKIHFASSHASLGLTTCLMVAGTTSGGIAARYSAAFKRSIKPAYLKLIHSTFGVITYVTAIFTLCRGIDSDWFRSQASAQWITILTYAVMAVAFLALTIPFISIAKKAKNAIGSV